MKSYHLINFVSISSNVFLGTNGAEEILYLLEYLGGKQNLELDFDKTVRLSKLWIDINYFGFESNHIIEKIKKNINYIISIDQQKQNNLLIIKHYIALGFKTYLEISPIPKEVFLLKTDDVGTIKNIMKKNFWIKNNGYSY